MKVLVIGSTGTIGTPVTHALEEKYEVIKASHSRAPLKVDIADPSSIQQLFKKVGKVDAVVSVAGHATFRPLVSLSDEDYSVSLKSKLMGQVNLVRYGLSFVNDRGSFTLSGGLLSRAPMPGGAAVSMVNAGLEGFVRAAAIELPRHIRINLVAPGWVRETLLALNMDPSSGTPADIVAQTYVYALESGFSGQVLDVVATAR